MQSCSLIEFQWICLSKHILVNFSGESWKFLLRSETVIGSTVPLICIGQVKKRSKAPSARVHWSGAPTHLKAFDNLVISIDLFDCCDSERFMWALDRQGDIDTPTLFYTLIIEILDECYIYCCFDLFCKAILSVLLLLWNGHEWMVYLIYLLTGASCHSAVWLMISKQF